MNKSHQRRVKWPTQKIVQLFSLRAIYIVQFCPFEHVSLPQRLTHHFNQHSTKIRDAHLKFWYRHSFPSLYIYISCPQRLKKLSCNSNLRLIKYDSLKTFRSVKDGFQVLFFPFWIFEDKILTRLIRFFFPFVEGNKFELSMKFTIHLIFSGFTVRFGDSGWGKNAATCL